MPSRSTTWSLSAGVYAFLCSTALLLLLSPVSNTLVGILGFPTEVSAFLLAGPVAGIWAAVWWAIVERQNAFTYPRGGIVGLITALFTALFWVLVYSIVWGSALVLTGGVLVLFVLAVSTPVAIVAGVPLMYARRRLGDGLSDGPDRAL